MAAFLLIMVLLALCAIAYFFLNWDNVSFRDNALGNLFATVVGLGIGIPTGFAIDRRLQSTQVQIDAQEREKREKEHLELLMDRIEQELTENKERVEELFYVLTIVKSSRKDIWEWAITIVRSFSFRASDELVHSRLQKQLPQTIEESLYLSYKALSDLMNSVEQAIKAHDFYIGYRCDTEQTSQKLIKIQSINRDVLMQLEKTISRLKDNDSKESEKAVNN